jgi:lysozyme
MQISQKGLQIIKEHEKLRLRAYDDKQPNVIITNKSQIKGVLTIGYGHTGNDVYVGQTITEAKALQLLQSDVQTALNTVNKRVVVKITQNMFDALCSLCFNIGITNFSKSDLLSILNSGDYIGASDEFQWWRKSGGEILQGLVLRRASEKELFLEAMGIQPYQFTIAKSNNDIASLGILGGLLFLS